MKKKEKYANLLIEKKRSDMVTFIGERVREIYLKLKIDDVCYALKLPQAIKSIYWGGGIDGKGMREGKKLF